MSPPTPRVGGALPRDLPTLTSLRALAALLVLGFHLHRWGVLRLPGAGIGETGVAFFFVLSGFLLTWGYSGGAPARAFYIRRFARIFPSHVVIWLVVLMLPVTLYPVTWWTAAVNLPLMQAWIPWGPSVFGMNDVTWSLSCEVAFYLAFPAVLLLARRTDHRPLYAMSATLLVAEGVAAVLASRPDAPEWAALAGFASPVVRFPEFLLGVAAATAVRSGHLLRLRIALPVVGVSLLGLALAPERPADNVWLTLVYAVGIVAAVQLDLRRPGSWLTARPIVYLGKVSFAFYLVHELIIINLLPYTGAGLGPAAIDLAVALLVAIVLHHAVEVPAQIALVSRFDSLRRTPRSDAAQA